MGATPAANIFELKNLHNKRRKMKEGHSGLAHVEAKIRIKDY